MLARKEQTKKDNRVSPPSCFFTSISSAKPWRPKDNITNGGVAGITEEPHQLPWNRLSCSFLLHLHTHFSWQKFPEGWLLTFRFSDWSSPYEQRVFQSPSYHHSNLLLTNSYLPRILGGRGCLIDSQPWAHMQGVINRPFSNLSGGQSALFMQCTDSRFHFLSGDKLTQYLIPWSSSPVEDSGVLTRRQLWNPVVCQQLRGPKALGGSEDVLASSELGSSEEVLAC